MNKKNKLETSVQERELINRVRASILSLEYEFLPIYPETILDVYEESINLSVIEMNNNYSLITKRAKTRIQKIIKKEFD